MFFTKEVIKEVKIIDKTRIEELEAQIKEMQRDFASEKRIAEHEHEMKIQKALKQEQDKRIGIETQNAVLKKEVEILEKAFENMGFDVKDMKEILNKLVDGLIAKNEIKVLK